MRVQLPPSALFMNMTPESKKEYRFAILLGLLTFIVTPVNLLVIAILFFLLGKVSESFNPVSIIAGIIGLQGSLPGYAIANMILAAFLALLGDFETAIISWFINRSKKFAAITFSSALIFQIVAVAIYLPATRNKSQEIENARIEYEKVFQQYATIGDVGFEIQEPFTEQRVMYGKLFEVSLFKKLVIIVPISVLRAGTYRVDANYSDREIGGTPWKGITQALNVGNNIIKIEFLANESREYGYTSPRSAGSSAAQIQLWYLAPQQELLNKLKSSNKINRRTLQQLMKDDGLDKGVSSNATVAKRVGRKEVQF